MGLDTVLIFKDGKLTNCKERKARIMKVKRIVSIFAVLLLCVCLITPISTDAAARVRVRTVKGVTSSYSGRMNYCYVNGKKIKGTLTGENDIKATTKKTELSSTPTTIPGYGQSTMPVLKHTIEVSLADTSKPVLLKGDIKKTVVYDEAGSIYGDAKASDVRVGKTFTSSNGVKVTGTLVTSEVKYGTITGKGMNSQAIETGLSNVSRFIMARKFPSTKGDAGVLSLVYKDGRLSGVSTSSSSMAVVDNYDIGTVAINKGTITYTPKANEKMSALTEGDTYDWIAINE